MYATLPKNNIMYDLDGFKCVAVKKNRIEHSCKFDGIFYFIQLHVIDFQFIQL